MTEEILRYTKYERARMIGSRALQLAMGAPFLVKMNEKELESIRYSPIDIAKAEFAEGLIPITVRRPLPIRRQKKGEPEEELVAEPDDVYESDEKDATAKENETNSDEE